MTVTKHMRLIASFALATLLGCTGLAAPQTADSIQAIRQQYASINRNAAKYRKVKKELSGFSTEGGELVAWFKGPSIVKISATFYGEMGRATDEFYYANDRLIFVFRKQSFYRRPLSGKVVRTTENRYYFKDDKLIRWIGEDGKQVSTTAPEFSQAEERLLASSKQFIEGARSNEPVVGDRP
jgi:hypothetical protein